MQRKYDWYALLSGAHEQAFRPDVCVSDSTLRRCRGAVEKVIASGMDRNELKRTLFSILESKVKKV